MKIVGTMDGGYLAQITEDEIAIITGFGRYPHYGSDDKKRAYAEATGRKDDRFGSSGKIPTNTIIAVRKGVDYAATVHEKIKTARKTAKELRELADLLNSAIPEILIPEDEP